MLLMIEIILIFFIMYNLRDKMLNKEINIPDRNLEDILRGKIGKRNGEPIYKNDLKIITRISAPEEGIKSLEGLQYCVNLRVAELWGNKISYIPDLSDLDHLEYLQLNGNFISDISGLSGLENIEVLILSGNNILDVSPLAGLTTLKELDLGGNSISDISPLKNLKDLELLYLSSNDISDISPLKNLTSLKEIYLSRNNISDISSLSSLTNLEKIYLSDNKISDLFPLIENLGINKDDEVVVSGNPLSTESTEKYIPELEKRGVRVVWGGRKIYITLHIEKLKNIPKYFVEITEEDSDSCLFLKQLFDSMRETEKDSIEYEMELQEYIEEILHCVESKYMEKYDLPMVGEHCTVKYRGTFYLVELWKE